MKLISKQEILDYEIESFLKDYSVVLNNHSSLIHKISSSPEAKVKLKKEILSLFVQ